MDIKSKEIKVVGIDTVIPNPKNPNKHEKSQIERLCKLIKNTGFRNPLIISNQTGFLVSGHGRLEAAKLLKMEKIPVVFQDFKNEADEYSFMTADNAIGSWSELDLEKIKLDSFSFDNFDIEMLGLENFNLMEMALEDEEDVVDDNGIEKLILQVELPNELELSDLYDDLISKGYMVKKL